MQVEGVRKHKEAVFVRVGSMCLNLPRAFFGNRNPVLAKNYHSLNEDAIALCGEVGPSNNLAKKVDFRSIVRLLAVGFLGLAILMKKSFILVVVVVVGLEFTLF